MAKTRTAPVEDQIEDQVDEAEVEDDETEDEESIVTPSDLASELNISAKSLRGFLRREFPRAGDQKNTSWRLTDDMVSKATAHFTASDEDDEEGEDEDES